MSKGYFLDQALTILKKPFFLIGFSCIQNWIVSKMELPNIKFPGGREAVARTTTATTTAATATTTAATTATTATTATDDGRR